MKIEVSDDYGFLLKEVYSGIGLESDSGEEFSICMRDSGFEFQYGGLWYEAKQGSINPIPTVSGEPIDKAIGVKGLDLGMISLGGDLHKIESIEEVDGDFDIDKIYEQKDVCKWGGNIWRFEGKPWAVNPDSGNYRTHFHTQEKTIGMYPSEKFGWRKI